MSAVRDVDQEPTRSARVWPGRLARLVSGALVLALAGGTVAAASWWPATGPVDVAAATVDVGAPRTMLVCPGPLGLPEDSGAGGSGFERVPVAPQESVSSFAAEVGEVGLTPLGSQTAAPGETIASPSAPVVLSADPVDDETPRVAGVTTSLVTAGDLRGLSAGSCSRPGADLWLAGGDTALQSTADLTIVNPGSTPADVTLELWGASGQVELVGGDSLLIAPGASRTLVLAGLAAEQRSVVVRVRAAGGRVAAWLQDSRLDGFTPQGTDLVTPGQGPATRQVVPGVSVQDTTVDSPEAGVLRLLAPGEEGTTAQITFLGPDGPVDLAGASTVDLRPGEVTDVPLGGLPAGTYTAVVDSDVPVVAGAMVGRTGGVGELDESARIERAWAASATTGGGLVAVPQGTSTSVALTAVGTGAAADGGRDVTGVLRAWGAGGLLGEQDVSVPAGTTTTVDLAQLVGAAGDVTAVRGVELVTGTSGTAGTSDSSGDADADSAAAGLVWSLVATAQQEDGELITLLTPLADSAATTQVRVREGQRLGLG